MKVEVAKTEDQIQEVFNIRKTVFVEEQKVPLQEEIDEFENDSTHFVLYDQKHAEGFIRLFSLSSRISALSKK